MQYKIEVRPLATIEIIEAYDWYELKRDGLGLDFLNELENFYESLLRNPQTYSYYEKPVREGQVKRFPYTVVYEVFDTTIVIYSVFMAKQNPSGKELHKQIFFINKYYNENFTPYTPCKKQLG